MKKSPQEPHLDVLIPGLLSSLASWRRDYGDYQACESLERLLSDAICTAYPQKNHQSLSLSLVADHQDEHIPAAVLRGGQTGQSLCADPVHFAASMNNVTVHRVTLAEDGLLDFQDLINQHVAENDMSFSILNSQQGLLTGNGLSDINSLPLCEVAGQSVQDKLPTGTGAANLQTLATEIQMLLFDSPVVEQTGLDGQLPVNGLWFWGEGDIKNSSGAQYQTLYGDLELKSQADFFELSYQPEPDAFSSLGDTENIGSSLIQLSNLQSAVEQDDFHQWQHCLNEYEEHWFKPLLSWIKSNPGTVIRLFDDQGQCFRLKATPWYKRFMKPKPLHSWCTT